MRGSRLRSGKVISETGQVSFELGAGVELSTDIVKREFIKLT